MSVPRTKKKKKKSSDDWIHKSDVRSVSEVSVEKFALCMLNAIYDELGLDSEALEKILVRAEQYSIHHKQGALSEDFIREVLFKNTRIKLTRDYYGI